MIRLQAVNGWHGLRAAVPAIADLHGNKLIFQAQFIQDRLDNVQVPVATLITRRYFKETGSIYLGSFTIAMLYTMMQVTQVSTNLGLIP